MGRCIVVYSDVFTRHEVLVLLATYIVDDHMKKTLFGIQKSIYSMNASQELLTMTTRYAP
jgi:hypothetical protein